MKSWIKCIIAGSVILGIGIAIVIIALACNGWSVKNFQFPIPLNHEFEMKTYTSEEEITKLKIELYAGSIETVYSDDDKITVEYPESEIFSTDCSLENGVLSISNGKRHWYSFTWCFRIPKITVKIPENAVYDLELRLNAGYVNLAETDYGKVNVYLNAGSLDMGKATCSDFTCELNAGSVNVKGLSTEKVYVKLNAGSFNADEVVCPDIQTKLNAGSASFGIIGIKSEYNVFVEKNAGSCNISNASGSTDKEIRAKINAGSLSFEFSN